MFSMIPSGKFTLNLIVRSIAMGILQSPCKLVGSKSGKRYSPGYYFNVKKFCSGPELQRTESNVEDGDTNVKLVEVTEICDCSECETSSSGSLSQ